VNLEDKLSNILTQLKKEEISLRETRDLYFEAKEEFFAAKEEEKTKIVGTNAMTIFLRVVAINQKFVEE